MKYLKGSKFCRMEVAESDHCHVNMDKTLASYSNNRVSRYAFPTNHCHVIQF